MAVTVSGGGTTTLTFNVTGSAATNYANALSGTFPATSTLSNGGTESTVAGALNIIYSNGNPTSYTLTTPDQVTFVSTGDADTIFGSAIGGDTLFAGSDVTYVEGATATGNRIVFTTGTNTFDGSSTGGTGDTIVGGSGDDTIFTGTGPSTVFSGTGHTLAFLDDTVGGDVAVMQSGDTTIYGSNTAGVDDTVSATATGEVFGGKGTLTFVDPGTKAVLPITVVGGTGTLMMTGGSNMDLTLSGGGTQIFTAGSGNETLDGSASGGFSFFGSTDAGAVTSVVGGNGDFFSTGAGTEYYTAGSNDIFNIASVGSANSITISDFSASDSVNFASPTVSSTTTNGTDYTVTLADGTTVEFVGITSLPTHTT